MGCQESKTAGQPVSRTAAGTLLGLQQLSTDAARCKSTSVPWSYLTKSLEIQTPLAQRKTSSEVALCFEGGGLKALTVYAGLTTAMLAAGKKYKGHSPKLGDSGLYDRFGHISSVSGGTWFAASLIYSEHFARLIDNMASMHDKAGAQFDEGWTQRWRKQSSGQSTILPKLEDLIREVHSNFGEKAEMTLMTLAELRHFFNEEKHMHARFSWTSLTEELLECTADLPPALQAGSKHVMPWSRDKLWLVNHVVVTPTDGSYMKLPPFEAVPVRAHMFQTFGIGGASYTLDGSGAEAVNKYPLFLPAAFAVKLGSGPSQCGPCFYSVVNALPPLQYKGTVINHCVSKTSSACSYTSADSSFDQPEHVGKMPVSGLSSASSAAGAWVHCLPATVVSFVQGASGGQFMPFVSTAAESGQAFGHAQDLVDMAYAEGPTQKHIDALAKAGVCGLGDAGFVDSTGVAGAIARGAREVVVFLSDNKPKGLTQLFEGRDSTTTTNIVSTINIAFGDDRLTVFSQPTATQVMEAYESNAHNREGLFFEALKIKNAKHVLAVKVGSITCTTADAKWYGIIPGQTIKVHVVSIETNVQIFFEDFFLYDEVVQEIVNCIMDDANASVVSDIVLPMFL